MSDEFEKQVEAGVLTFVFNVHNGAGSLADQFRHIGLRPALFLSGSVSEPFRARESQTFFHLGSFSYHPISLYISG